MVVVDASTERGQQRESSLPFEGFCEALCRVAVLKALPSDAEILASSATDAYEYIAMLDEEDETVYEAFLASHCSAWGAEPQQPLARCVAHLMALIFRTMMKDLGERPSAQQGKQVGGANSKQVQAAIVGGALMEVVPQVRIPNAEVGLWFSKNERPLGLLSTSNTTRSNL